MQRILDELAVSELLHTFSSSVSMENCVVVASVNVFKYMCMTVQVNEEGDTNLPTAVNGSYLYNIWQVHNPLNRV